MSNRALLFLLATVALAQAAAPEQGHQKLRSLSRLPSLNLSVSLTSRELEHPELRFGTNELARQIAALKKELNQTPGDAERYLRIGRNQEAAKRSAEAKESFAQAVPLFRLRAEARPHDGKVQVQFAEALDGAGKFEEAEHVLQAATRASPDDWSCWARLGASLDSKGLRVLYGGTNHARADQSLASQVSDLLKRRPTPDQVKEAEMCQVEADRCFDHAVALAPKEPGAYLARAIHRSCFAGAKQMLRQFRDQQKAPLLDIFESMASAEVCADFGKAARLAPTNYAAIGYWGWAEAIPGLLHQADDKAIDSLPESRRKNVLEAMRLLEGLADHPNAAAAAGALEALGALRMLVTQESDGARAAWRRAVTLDPSRAQAWDGLVGLATDERDPQRLLSVCEERVKYADTAWNRVALAKACDRAGLQDKAIAHARQATKRAPQEPLAHLCVGALLLRRAPDEKSSDEMKKHFLTARQLIDAMQDNEERNALVLNYGLNLAIMMALEGQADEARESLRKLARMDAVGDAAQEQIKEIETAIGR